MTRTSTARKNTAPVIDADTDDLETQDEIDEHGTSTAGIYVDTLSIRDLMAGRPTFTVVTNLTNKSFTYLVRRRKNKPEVQEKYGEYSYYINLLTGPDNQNSYSYMGALTQDKHGVWTVKRTDASVIFPSAESWIVMAWLLRKITRNKPYNYDKGARVMLEGRCFRCRRKITTEQSLLNMYGPWCYRQMLLGK